MITEKQEISCFFLNTSLSGIAVGEFQRGFDAFKIS